MRRLSSCLYTLPTFQRRVLVLRTGVGDGDPTSRRRVARRLDVGVRTIGRAESRGLVALRRNSGGAGCGGFSGFSGFSDSSDFPAFMPLAFAAPMPTLTQFASLPSGDPADPNFDPSAGDAGSVLGFNESSDAGGDYSGLESGLENDESSPATETAKRTAAATSDGAFLPLPLILMVLLLLAGGVAYAILGRTRRRTAGVPEEPGSGVTMASAAPPAPAPAPLPAAPERIHEPEPQMDDEPAPWLADEAFADEPGPTAGAERVEPKAPEAPTAAAPPAVGRRRQGGLVGRVAHRGDAIRRKLGSRRRGR